jgi:hypothetical protein
MDRDFIALPASKRPAERARLEGIFLADSARERARGVRQLLVHLLAVLGVPLGLAALWPRWLSPRLLAAAASAWALCSLGVLASVAWELAWKRRRSWRIADLGPLPSLRGGARAAREDVDEREACAAPADEES